jgi:hypothetical protein
MIKKVLFSSLLFSFLFATSQTTIPESSNRNIDLGIFENKTNIGKPSQNGTVKYNSEEQEYTISGSGMNMWGGSDQFEYLYKSIQGDFILRARVEFVSEGGDPHRKIGWIIRNDLRGSSAHVNATVHGDGSTALQYRRTDGAETEELTSTDTAPDVIQLERRGDTYLMSTAKFGEPFRTVQIDGINLNKQVFVGLYVCSHDPNVMEDAFFTNVRIIKPAPENFKPYDNYLGSNLEILNVITGHRKVLFYSAHSLQAPNWINHDKLLVYNSNGFLYKYRFRTKEVKQINTGFAINNNNDHVFSMDEKILGISNQNPDDGGISSIYIMNPKGDSIPKKITHDGVGASYLHGISPDNKTLL